MEAQITRAGMRALGARPTEGEWHVDRIRYCFQMDPHIRIPLLTDGQICILRAESPHIN